MAWLYRGHAGLFKMRDVAKSYFWWPHMNRQIQLIAVNCKERFKSGKNLKSVVPKTDVALTDLRKDRIKKFK